MKHIAFVVRRGPDHGLGIREMIDMAFVFSAFECRVTLILQDEGVLWAEMPVFTHGYPSSITGKLKSLSLYDIRDVIIHEESLVNYPFVEPQLPGTIESTAAINERKHTFDIIMDV